MAQDSARVFSLSSFGGEGWGKEAVLSSSLIQRQWEEREDLTIPARARGVGGRNCVRTFSVFSDL
jgi:hypothetical protein